MCTVLVSYEPTNAMANHLMAALSMTKGIKIEEDDTVLTPEEWERVRKSEQSGMCSDIDNLLTYLKSQL